MNMKTETKVSETKANAAIDKNDPTKCNGKATSAGGKPTDAPVKPALNIDSVKENLLQKYDSRRGKQLYIRFPHRIPETEEILWKNVKTLSPLVVKVHKPRQKHARFCLVDYQSTEDRNKAYNDLKTAIRNRTLPKHMVHIPRTESDAFLNHLAERRLKAIQNRKAKLRLKKAIKKSKQKQKDQQHTTSIVVHNLPEFTTFEILRAHFPKAVDIHINHGKGKLGDPNITATVTLPTTQDAHEAVKLKLCICGKPVKINYDSKKPKIPKNPEKAK